MNTVNFTSVLKPSKHIIGSGQMGYVDCPYEHLVNLFGEPTILTDKYKTSAEWHIEVRRNDKLVGAVAIYDYKQHDNYTGDGMETKDITCWHIGAKRTTLAGEVMAFIKHPHLIKYSQNV